MIKRIKNRIIRTLRPVTWFFRRKLKKLLRIFTFDKNKKFYTLAIVCVKKIAYVDMAIKNINSMHYLNSNHRFVIYCDNTCYKEVKKRVGEIDYQDKVEIRNAFGESDKPWQHYKLETIIEISKNNWIMVDADAFWHSEPKVDPEKITFLVSEKKIKEEESNRDTVIKLFGKEEWLDFRNYSSGFLSIPAKFMTSEVIESARKFLSILLYNDYSFLDSEKVRGQQKRQSEQFSINLALLVHYPERMFTTLKETDGVKNTHILQSLYYGCEHQINE